MMMIQPDIIQEHRVHPTDQVLNAPLQPNLEIL